jgi:ABC-type Zn uptake system ZnuABC Zn-binding protein ZnuA
MFQRLFYLALLVLVPLGCDKATETHGRKLAATNTYLECAAMDLLGSGVQILRLAEPGTCPSSIDIRPSQASELQRCQILLRFDFQKSLDARLQRNTNTMRIVEASVPGGMCEPASYLAVCRQLADAFVSLGWLERGAADIRIKQIDERLKGKTSWARKTIAEAKLAGRPVIASGHQKAFCEWLGLTVVAAFRPADNAGIGEIEHAINTGVYSNVKLLIANQPEGRRVADALADRLSAKVVVFANFPPVRNNQAVFDDMLTANVEALVKAGAQ